MKPPLVRALPVRAQILRKIHAPRASTTIFIVSVLFGLFQTAAKHATSWNQLSRREACLRFPTKQKSGESCLDTRFSTGSVNHRGSLSSFPVEKFPKWRPRHARQGSTRRNRITRGKEGEPPLSKRGNNAGSRASRIVIRATIFARNFNAIAPFSSSLKADDSPRRTFGFSGIFFLVDPERRSQREFGDFTLPRTAGRLGGRFSKSASDFS